MINKLFANFLAKSGYQLIKGKGIKAPSADMDQEFIDLLEKYQEYTMTSSERLYALYKAVEYLCSNDIQGAIVECGVWKEIGRAHV